MHIKKYTSQLLTMVSYAERDKELELEVLVKKYNSKITSEMFYNTIKRLKGYNNIIYNNELEILDIIINENNIRFSIIGNESILKYCQTDDINSVDEKNIIILKKTNMKHTDINEYNIRFNLKRETIFKKSSPEVISTIKKWNTVEKIFRYKKRISYISSDNNFQYDLTLVKSSNKKNKKDSNTKIKRNKIKDYMKKYMVKPDYVLDFNEWFNKLKDYDDVMMMGKTYQVPLSTKKIKNSNVFNNDIEYEIEIEYIGNKSNPKLKLNTNKILLNMCNHLVIVLQSIQKSYYIISEFEKRDVINKYKAIMGYYKFNAPMNVTLEKKHVLSRKYEDYQNLVSIRKGYSVTDKADGERNLLIIIDNGNMYLINRKNDVKYIGGKCIELKNSIFDCEYILTDKVDNNINLLALFDSYFYNGIDIRKRILNRSNEEIDEGLIKKSRYEYLTDTIDIIRSKLVLERNNNLLITKKKFYFGDDNDYNNEIELTLDKLNTQLLILEDGSEEYIDLESKISKLKCDTKIFVACDKVYNKDYIYKIDGLIFTPRNLFVGEEPGKLQKNMHNGRWYRSFKWKPPEQNTIDFSVEILKDTENVDSDLIKYMNIGDSIKPYKTLILKVGYDPKIHTKYNSCRILNENLVFDPTYNYVPFSPTEPYIKDIHLAYIPIENNNIYTIDDKNIIEDNMIIECVYDKDEPSMFKWKPLRVRDNLNPNDFITATNVWNCIHDSVTLDMITSGNIDIVDEFDIYYNRNMKRSEKKCASMYDFHSFIKKTIIMDNTLGSKNMLDMSVGRGGDLNHWIDANVNLLVGIDISKDGLIDNPNGACNRILNKMNELDDRHIGDNYIMLWGDTSKNLLDSSSGKDDLNKYYLDIIYGNIPIDNINNGKLRNFYNLGNIKSKDGGFDVVSSQFSIHYYFKNKEVLHIFLNNVSQSLKIGGRFIGTCLNGEEVFNALKSEDIISNTDKTLCWKISKRYKQTNFSPSETSLGMEIGVYNESVGATFNEYLVNIVYLTELCETYKLKLIETNSFESMFSKVSKSYGKSIMITDELKKYSFMNNYFIFEKTS